MELLIALFFFAIAGAICLQLFAGAHLSNKSSETLSSANVLFTQYAESFYSADIVALGETNSYYNDSLSTCDRNSSHFLIKTNTTLEDSYYIMNITITDTVKKDDIVNMELKKYKRSTY